VTESKLKYSINTGKVKYRKLDWFKDPSQVITPGHLRMPLLREIGWTVFKIPVVYSSQAGRKGPAYLATDLLYI